MAGDLSLRCLQGVEGLSEKEGLAGVDSGEEEVAVLKGEEQGILES